MASRQTSSARRALPRTDSFKIVGNFGGYTPLVSLGDLGETELYLGQPLTTFGPQRVLLEHLPRSRRGYLALRERMIEEGRLADKLTHPSFLPFLDAHEEDAGFTLAYELPNGTDLARVITDLAGRGEALPFELVVHIVRELARAVAFAHREHALLLRELCPENVLIGEDGRVFIATYRLALGAPDQRRSGRASAHVAPECLSRGEYGIASDVYGLGVLLFTLFMGRPPRAGNLVPLDELEAEGVPRRLMEIVARATHPAKAQRYQGALRLAGELDSWIASRGAPVTAEVLATFFSLHRLGY